jgi:hypothetical protein
MTRAELEARIWAITGRQLTGADIDAITDACEQYAAERVQHTPRQALHHTSGTDLYPVIGALASALLGDAAPEHDELALRREWRGAA